MSRVDFYVLERAGEPARVNTACRLASKAFAEGKQVWIQVATESMASEIDAALWTFEDRSFVPHECWSGEGEMAAPVLIATGACPQPWTDVLINISDGDELPPSLPDRVLEIIGAGADERERGRLRYRQYRDGDHELHTHHL